PSRIHLAVNSDLGNSNEGYFVEEYVKANDAIAGINAGGFDDPNGQGTGGIPYGIVIQDGELVSGGLDDYNSVIGFNEQNKLIVGNMTGRQALEYGLRDAVTFKPIFIVNYVPVEVTGTGGGVNPRTVIGQREDGAVLLLVIDGRQTTSLGASYSDCIDIMTQYGAMNAANLDGGSSSVMVYDGQIINNVVSMNGDRKVPTAFIVK
ncbi:MAG: phosphodiester glycosidase family protein, partial [Holdemania filiformis]